jgi:filamentous hemagglutinin family protein
MNRIYRTLWSVATQSWQAVPETAKTAGKKSKSSAGGAIASFALSWVLTGGASAQAPPAINQLPTGGTVARGTATISQTATAQAAAMTVNQTSQRAVVNWNTFNIGSAASVNFVQPNAQAVTLNRVNDSNPSQIFGRMTSNGQVVLTNANGIYFAPGSSVDVGAITATTHSITDDNFMSSKYVFERNGATGKIINEGNITATLAGYVALLAPEVQNAGVVVARAGTVAMAAGETITLNIDGAGSLAGITTTPSAIATLIENKQAVQAPDGQIILSAVALNKLQAGVIKNSGSLEANSLVSKGGKIYLEGDDITLSSTSKLEAKGATGGGTVLVGGDWQGSGEMRQATKVTMEAGATIDASATDKGDGGKVVLWSDVHNADSVTAVHGSIKAEAGPNGGDGGKVETSGHVLAVDDSQVSTRANQGHAGHWLLDPYNIIISTGTTTTPGVTFSGGVYSTNINSILNNTTLQNALTSGNVEVSTAGAGGGAGNISVTAPVSWNSAYTLKLSAAGAISGTGNISIGTGGGLTFNQADATGSSNIYSGIISGDGSFTKEGAGIAVLTGANIYTGTTTISTGTLQFGNGGATATALMGTGTVVNYGTLAFNAATNQSFAPNTISGTGAVTVSGTTAGSGTVTLRADNTYSGGITINSGPRVVAGGSSTGAVGALTSGPFGTGTLNLNQSSQVELAGYNIANGVKSNINNATPTIYLSTGTSELSGQIDLTLSGSGIKLSPALDSTLRLTGTLNASTTDNNNQSYAVKLQQIGAGNIFEGFSSINSAYHIALAATAGTWTLASDPGNTIGLGTKANLTLSGGTFDSAGNDLGNGIASERKQLTLFGGTLKNSATTTSKVWAVDAYISANSTLSTPNVGGDLDFTNTNYLYPQTTVKTLTKTGLGDLHMKGAYVSGSNVDFNINVLAGNLYFYAAGTSSSFSGAYSLAAGTKLFLNNAATFPGTITGDGAVVIRANTTLSGANTYTGGTTVLNNATLTQGRAVVVSGNTITSSAEGTGDITLGDANTSGGINLGGYSKLPQNIFVNGAASISSGAASADQVISGVISDGSNAGKSLNFATSASGKAMEITGNNTYTGPTTINGSYGFVLISNANALGASSAGTTLGTSSTLKLKGDITLNEPITVGASFSTFGNLSGNNTLTATYTQTTFGSTITSDAGTLTFAPTTGNAINDGTATATLTFLGAGNIAVNGPIIGSTGTVTKNGTGTLAFGGANTYTGDTTISAGTLVIANAGSLGSGTYAGAITNNGIFQYSSSAAQTLSRSISGTGSLIDDGAGTLTLTGASIYTGSTTISNASSTLVIGGAGSLGNGAYAGAIANSGTFQYASSAAQTLSGLLSGTGILVKGNTGTLTLSGANTYSGGTSLNGGALLLNSAGAIGSTGSISFGGGTLQFSASNTTDYSPRFSTADNQQYSLNTNSQNVTLAGNLTSLGGSLTKLGVGTLSLSGANSYSGTSTITTGTLKAGSATAFGTSAISLTSGAVLDLNGQTIASTGGLTLNGTGIGSGGALINSSATASSYAGLVALGSATSIVGGTGTIALSNTGTITGATYGLTLGGAMGGAIDSIIGTTTGTMTKQGAGTWALNGANTYSGSNTISAGTLKAGSATAFGTGTINLVSSSALDLNGQTMTSTGGLTLNGTGISSGGALINSSATGATYAGLVTLGSASSIVGGAGTIALTNTGTISGATYGLTLDGAAGGSITSIIGTSSGTITKQGLGTWILSGANTFTGAVAINAGALRAANSAALGTTAGGVTVASGATLELGGPASPSGIAVGAEVLTVADGGAVHNVAGYNTYAGAMTLSGNATITVDTGTTLNFTATTATAVLTGKRLTLNTNGDLTFSKGLSGPITAAYLKTGSGTLSMGTGNYGSLTAVTGIYAGLYDPTGTDYSSVYGSNPDYTFAFFNSASGGIKVNLTASDYSGTATWSGTLPTSGSTATTYSLSYASGLTVSNAVYVLLGATNATTWTVTPKPVTVTLTPPSSTYNGITTYADITNATTFTTTSLVGADTVTAITKTSSATGVAQAGNFTITPGISSLSAGAVASNYSFTLSPLTASVAKANLTLTGSKVYDGTTVAAGSQLTATGVNNEAFAITGLGASGNLSTANVQNNTALTSASGLSVGASNGSNAGDLNNYNTLSTTGSSFTVRPATAILAATKAYDGDSTLTSSQLTITGITVGGVTQTLGYSGSASLFDANVATANNYVTSSNLSLANNGSFLASNYVLPTFTRNANNSATVNAATATVTASKTYDSDTTLSAGQVTITGVSVNGTAQTLGFTGTAALSDANVATANKYVNTGGMTLTDGSTGVASNYVLPASAYNATRNTATINRFALTATDINTSTSVYGDTLAPGSVMFTNKFGADDVNAAVTVTVPAGSLSTGGAAKVGSYFQSASSSLSGAQAGNYTFAGLTSSSDNYSITQRALTASAISSSASAYASAIGPGTAQLSNAISGDAVAAPVTVNTGATSSSGHFVTGVYTQTAGTTLSGADAGNYSFTGYTSAANYTIQRLALTGTSVANSSSTYGSALAPGAVTWTNVVGADAVSASAAVATSTTSSSGQFVAGNYAQTVASNSLTGTDANNYSFASSFTTPSNNYTIQKRALTAVGEIASASSTYGSAVTPGALAFANVVASDAVSATVSVNTSTLSSGGKPVAGSYTQTASTALTGADAGNYTYVGRTSASANYTIDPLTLTGASIASGTSVYGNALAPGAVSFGNLVSGDQVSSTATVDTSTRSMANLPVFGTYTQTIGSTLTGTDAANYILPTGFTSAANYTISKKELLISVPGASRMYDGSNSIFPTGTSTILGLIGADNVSISSGNVTGFVDKNVGTNKPVTYTGFTFTGGDASNYVLSANPASTAEITAKPITVSGITANDKVYNATASASLNLASAAYTSGAASNTDNKVYTGDSVSIDTSSVAGTFSNANVGTAKPVTISGLALSGADANNYIVTDASNAAASITAKALTVSGLSTAATRAYNGTQVATISGTPTLLSAQVAGAGIGTDGTPYQGDVINITGAATGSYNSKDVGATTVTFGGLASSNSNYTLVLGTQAASITKADLSKVTATKVYDGLGTVTAAQVSAIEGVNGETFTASAGTASISDKNVATPNKVLTDLSSLSLASSNGGLVSNYNLSTNLPAAGSQNAVDISKANLSKITADKVYDGLSTVTAAQVTAIEGVNGETFTAASGTANISNKNVATANKTLTDLSGLSLVGSSHVVFDSNYNLSTNLPAAGALNAVGISQANASVSVTSANVVYNGQTQSQASPISNGFLSGDAITISGAASAKNAGTYASALSVTGSDATNYNVSITDANLTIGKAALTITGSSFTNTYNSQTQSVTGFTTSAMQGTDTAADLTNVTATGASARNAGTYTNTVSASAQTNYDLTLQNGTLQINRANASVGGISTTVTYNGQTQNQTAPKTTGFISGDAITIGGAASGKNVGTYASTLNVTGSDAANYNVSITDANMTIGKATLSISLSSQTKVYDGTSNATIANASYSLAGFVPGEGATFAQPLGSYNNANVAGASTVSAGIGAGNFTVNNGTLLSNYVLPTTVSGAGSITPAHLSATGTKTYDGLIGFDASSLTVAGVNGETFTASGSGTLSSKNVQTNQALTSTAGLSLSGNNGALMSNYTPLATGDTQVSVTARAVNMSAPSATKTYDSTTLYEVSATDLTSLSTQLVGGDRVAAAEVVYGDKNAGTGKRVTLNAVTINDDNGGNNYVIGKLDVQTGVINKAPLSVVVVNDARFINQADTAGYAGVVYNGFVGGETASVLTQGSVARSNASVNGAGQYTGVLQASGWQADNYAISYRDGNYTIAGAKTLLVRVSSASTIYGSTASYTPTAKYLAADGTTIMTLTPVVTGNTVTIDDGLGSQARFSIDASSAALSSSGNVQAGGYNLGASNVTKTGTNFENLVMTGGLTVTPKTLSNNLGVQSITKVYDGSTSISNLGLDFDRPLAGVTTGDTVTLVGSGSFDDRHVGTNKTVNLSLGLRGADAINYALTTSSLSTNVGEITQLASVTYTGASNGNWSDARNWAGGALPDRNNVAQVIVPIGKAVTYDSDQVGVIGSTLSVDGVIRFGSSNPFTLANTVSGAGDVQQRGTGMLTVSGSNNNFSGHLDIGSYAATLNNAQALGLGGVTANAGQLSVATGLTLPSLRVNGAVTLDSAIKTTGDQIYNGALTFLSSGTAQSPNFLSDSGNIEFVGTVSAGLGAKSAQRSMFVVASNGSVLLNDQVGRMVKGLDFNSQYLTSGLSDTSPYALNVTAQAIKLYGDVTTFESQTYNGAVRVGNNSLDPLSPQYKNATPTNGYTRLLVSMDPSITFKGAVDDADANGKTNGLDVRAISLTQLSANSPVPTITFDGDVGKLSALASLIAAAGIQNTANGAVVTDIKTDDASRRDQAYKGDIVLKGNITVDSAPILIAEQLLTDSNTTPTITWYNGSPDFLLRLPALNSSGNPPTINLPGNLLFVAGPNATAPTYIPASQLTRLGGSPESNSNTGSNNNANSNTGSSSSTANTTVDNSNHAAPSSQGFATDAGALQSQILASGSPLQNLMGSGAGVMVADVQVGTPDNASPAKTQAQTVSVGSSGAFIQVREFAPTLLQAAQPFSYQLPQDTFRHSNATEMLTFSASLANGSALPAWLNFSSQELLFSGTPPSGVKSLEIEVFATDRQGRRASTRVRLVFAMEAGT